VHGFEHFAVNGAGRHRFLQRFGIVPQTSGACRSEAVAYPGMPAPPNGSGVPDFDASGLQLSVKGQLVFGSDAGGVGLHGQQPTLAGRAHRRANRLQGVEYVINKTELLPSGTGGQDSRRRMLSDNGRIAFRAELIRVKGQERPAGCDRGEAQTATEIPPKLLLRARHGRHSRSTPGVPARIRVLDNDSSPVGLPFRIHSVRPSARMAELGSTATFFATSQAKVLSVKIRSPILWSTPKGTLARGGTISNPFLALRRHVCERTR
jgi:hypothetical protein